MKQFLLIIFTLLLSFTSFSQKLKTYVHPTDNFEIGIPKKWNFSETEGPNLVIEAPKYGSRYRKDGTIIIYIREAGSGDIEEIYKYYIKSLKRMRYSTIDELGEEKINGKKYFVYYIYRESGGLQIKAIEYFTVKENKIFTARFSSAEQNFDNLEPLFNKVALTIKY